MYFSKSTLVSSTLTVISLPHNRIWETCIAVIVKCQMLINAVAVIIKLLKKNFFSNLETFRWISNFALIQESNY